VPVVIEGFRKGRGISQFGKNTGVRLFDHCRHVDLTLRAVDKTHEKPEVR
jgi:hypothetical protein